ncbi:hypothetical protein DL93DRAFT_2070820 [Clavulina sp. PMI_390]|nr:hypothetical protein DL93DRAFT_2070820 [Clavulina sp. PMI_390]
MNDQAASKAKNEKKLPNTRLAVSNLVEANLNQACISPPSARKRSPAEIARSRHQCEFGLSKCGIYSGIPSSYSSSSRESEPEFSAVGAYECIDTMFNLESCGGCVVPYTLGLTSDEVAELEPGVDCTAMPHVSDVECRMGRCIVHKCHAGSRRVPVLLANGDAGFECVPEGTILKGQSGVFNFLG